MRLTRFLLSRFGGGGSRYSNDYSNLPASYVKRASEQVYWRNPTGMPSYRSNVRVERKKYHYDVDRPWTAEFRNANAPGRWHKKIFVEPIAQWSYFRGDRVEILVGKDKGKQGIVKQVIQERNWVIIEGINCELTTVGRKNRGFPGIVVQKERPLLVTDEIALVDPSDLKATSIEWRYTDDGQRVRVSSRTGRIVPIPATSEETIDYKSKSTYKEQAKDTSGEDATEISFAPKLCTFEMDVMNAMGIDVDDGRVPIKTFWY